MKKLTMLCCLIAMLCTVALAAESKIVDQTVTPQMLLDAKLTLELEMRQAALEQQIMNAKETGMVSEALMAEYAELMLAINGRTPAQSDLDEGGEACADATDLGGTLGANIASGTTAEHTNDITNAPVLPNCYQGNWNTSRGTAADVTYKWTAPRTSLYTFSLCGSSYDTEISLWQYSCPLEFPADYICGNDDPSPACESGSFHSRLTCVELQEGQEVLIVVDGFSTASGEYILSIFDCTPSCADVDFVAPFVYQGNTCEQADDCDLRSTEDVVVAVEIPHAGIWTFFYEGLDFDPYLHIGYECCTDDICSDDDGGGNLNSLCECVYLEVGTVYVTLEGFSDCGAFVLTVTEGACVTGRCCYTNSFGVNDCATNSLEDCLQLGGVWAEGENCDTAPCAIGRCCYFDDGEPACETTGEAFCLYQLGGEWIEGASCNEACPAPGDCGPIDLVFAVDVSGSMQAAIDNIIAELPNIIAVANVASGNDLRLGLVTFSSNENGDAVHTEHNLTVNHAAVQASIAALVAGNGGSLPEASDEALREIITNDALCTDGTEFTSAFRPAASKIIVLITDASNGGCDDIHDASDIANAHQRALDAASAGIRISSVYVPNFFGEAPAVVLPILDDYALTSAGSVRIVAANGAGTGGAINQILRDCGQGELQLFYEVPDLRCDPNGGGITTPTFDADVDVYNDGSAICHNAVLTLTGVVGDGGSAVVNSVNPVLLGDIAPNATVNSGFNVTITPDGDGGQIILNVTITSDDCPPNFTQVVINVPDCTPCDGETEVYLFEDDLRIPPACMCAYLCQGTPLHVFVCGEGLTAGRYPILSITPGCRTEDCNEDCDPAQFLFSNTGWTLWGDSCWHNLIIPQGDGCVCICFERFLPVELGSFAAVSRDAEIQLNWSTSSETDNDHFELMRDGMMTAHVTATNNPSGSSYTFVDQGLVNGRSYHYELVSVGLTGDRAVVGELNAVPQAGAAIVTELALHQNYPNPFNPETNISFDLIETGNVTLKIYNAVGQEVALLVNGTMNEGRHTVVFDAAGLPSGLYFYRLTVGETTMQKKMLLLK